MTKGNIALSNTINIALQSTPSGLGEFNTNNIYLFTNEKPLSVNPYIWAISADDIINEYGTDSKTAKMGTSLFTPSQNLRSGGGQVLVFPYSATDATSSTLTTPEITAQDIINFQKVTNGTFTIVLDGTEYNPIALDFSAINTIDDIVSVLNNIGLDCNISVVNDNQIQFESRRYGEDGSITLKQTLETDLSGSEYLNIADSQKGAGTDGTPEIPATAGTTTTEPLTENISNFQSVSDGVLTLEIDGTDYQFTALDFQQANDVTKIANVIQTAITGKEATAGNTTTPDIQANVAGFQSVSDGVLTLEVDGVSSTVTELDFSSTSTLELIKDKLSEKIQNVTITVENENQLRFTSNTTGANSSVKLVETAEAEGTDLYQASYLNGAQQTEQQGKNKPSCTVSVVDGDKIQFTSNTTGASSKVDLKETQDGGTDIYGINYLDGETQYIVFGADIVPAVPSTSAYITTPEITVDNFKQISKGTFTITIDGETKQPQNLNFSLVETIQDVVGVLDGAGLECGIEVVESNKIQFTTPTQGTSGSIEITTTPIENTAIDIYTEQYLNGPDATTTEGVNCSGVKLQEALMQAKEIAYCGGILTTQLCENATVIENSTYIQTTDHVYYEVTQSLANISELGATIKSSTLNKTRLMAYSSGGAIGAKQAIASYSTTAQSVNYNGTNTSLTMNLKELSGLAPDTNLNQTYYNLAKQYGVDLYATTEGLSCVYSFNNGYYTDEATADLWLKKNLEVNGFNCLRQTNTKIPQTETGLNNLKTAYEQSCIVGVRNGSFAPGTWNGAIPFGDPEDFKRNIEERGYYIYSIPIAQQAQTEREARIAPLIQIALKRAGAFHSSDVIVNIQR